MARDSYRDEYFTSSEIHWLARQTSLSINLLNQNIFNNHNLKLIYNTTVVFPPPKVNITYSAEKGLLTIDNSANNFSIGFELLDPSSESANRIGFKTTVYNDKKTYYNFSSLYPFVDKPFNMVIAFAHNLCFLTPIDDLYKINGENLNKTGFLKYPIHEQTPNYDSTSPYIVYQDSANTDNLKFVGFSEYKINEGKTNEDIILNGYCDVKISQGQVDQYNLPYAIANYKNNKELNLVNYCLPLFNNFDKAVYENLDIKYTNNTLFLKTIIINGKYKMAEIPFDPTKERIILYNLLPIGTELDNYNIPWILTSNRNITCKDDIKTFKNTVAHASASVFGLNENWKINCDFQYDPQEVSFKSITPSNEYQNIFRLPNVVLDNNDWNFLINYTTVKTSTNVDHTWSYDDNGTSGVLYYGIFKIDGKSYSSSDLDNNNIWNNVKQNGYVYKYHDSSDDGYLILGYKASINFTIRNFPNFRGKYISFSQEGIYSIESSVSNASTHWYDFHKIDEHYNITNYGMDKFNAAQYGFINTSDNFNGQSLFIFNNLLRVKRSGLIYRQGNSTPESKNIHWDMGIYRINRYVEISIPEDVNTHGLYALWLQTDDTSKQITWQEYSE